ncbi:zinc finger protein 184-like [Armigeres subalbatus]|uniref:zinc finger protein 184-like n=1 Tax=Armigeres subalbatus TaxID=124917 RepID=UPI002ED492F1
MATKLLPIAITAKQDLKAVKTKMRFRKDDVRQCRLCLRMLPRGDVRITVESDGYDIRRKILDAVGVKIREDDKVKGVCDSCLLLVETVNHFRETCRRADIIHRKRLLMMHPGRWASDESKKTFEDCHTLVKRNRFEMDGLFKCFERKEEDARLQPIQEVHQQIKEDNSNPEPTGHTMVDKDDTGNQIIVGPCETVYLNHHDQVMPTQSDEARLADSPEPELLPAPTTASGKRIVMCDICGQFIEISRLSNHRYKHVGVRPYVCPYEGCGKNFFSAKILSNHRLSIHLGSVSMEECEVCQRKLKGKKQLSLHMLTHGEGSKNSRKSPCNVCGRLFYKSYLKDHMAVHTGNLAYTCKICGRQFAAMNNLTSHWKKMHPDVEYDLKKVVQRTDDIELE